MTTFRIPAANWFSLTEKISKLARKASKLGLAPIVCNKIGEDVHENEDGTVSRFVTVDVSGESPTLNGWSFVARLNHIQDDNGGVVVVVGALPGETVPAAFRDAPQECEHCHKHIRRNETFVVRNEGIFKQVGRTCLKDFTGNADPEALAAYAELLIEAREAGEEAEEESGRGSGRAEFGIVFFLAATAAEIRRNGWTSRSRAAEFGGSGTADKTLATIYDQETHIAPEDVVLAENVREWVKALDAGENDYLCNLKAAVTASYVIYKTAGIVASVFAAYQRAQEAEKIAQTIQNSQHVGTVGQKDSWTLTVTGQTQTEGAYGTTTVVRFVDQNGNVFVWFASGAKQVEEGVSLTVKGTIKEHGEFRGTKQTILTRCKIG